MRLVIEVIGSSYPNGAYELSIAHYAEQNGDAMREGEEQEPEEDWVSSGVFRSWVELTLNVSRRSEVWGSVLVCRGGFTSLST